MLDYKIIGKRIRGARKKEKFTQAYIAEKLDVSVPYISRIENGSAKVSLKKLDEISEILNIDTGYLVSGTNLNSDLYMIKETTEIFADCSPEDRDFAYEMLRRIVDLRKKEVGK